MKSALSFVSLLFVAALMAAVVLAGIKIAQGLAEVVAGLDPELRYIALTVAAAGLSVFLGVAVAIRWAAAATAGVRKRAARRRIYEHTVEQLCNRGSKEPGGTLLLSGAGIGVIRALNRVRALGAIPDADAYNRAVFELVVAMRRDLGDPTLGLRPEDVLAMLGRVTFRQSDPARGLGGTFRNSN